MKRFAILVLLLSLCLAAYAALDVRSIVQSRQEAREQERQAQIRWMDAPLTTSRDMDDYDARYYKIDIDVNYDDEHVTAAVTARVEVTAVALDTLELHFADILAVDGVTMGAQTLGYTHADGILAIDLGQSFSQGEIVEVVVAYSGYPDQTRLEDGLKFEEHAGTPIAFTMVSPMGARKWWPCKDTPADKPDSIDVWVRHPVEYTCVSNGMLQGVTDHGDGTATTMYHESYPVATYLTSFAFTNYDLYGFDWTYDGQNMPVDNYYYPEQEQISIDLYSRCGEMLTFFSDTYGTFPFIDEKYGHATCTSLGAVAMEHQTCTSFNASYIADESAEYTVAHELAHSWAGDCLSISDWSEVWLKEGFAVYSEALWAEHQLGEQALFDYMDAEDTGGALNEALYRDPSQGASHIFHSVVYNKGAWVLHMLRYTMGDDSFFTFLRDYFTDPALLYGNTDMQILEDHAEAAYGDELDWFFDQWFYQEGRPRYEYAVYQPLSGGGMIAIHSLSNSGEPFDMFLPYEFEGNDGRVFVEGGMHHVEIPEFIEYWEDITWDPDGWILDGGFTRKTPVLEEVPGRHGAVGLVWQSWFDNEIDGFTVMRALSGEMFTDIAFVPAGQNGYLDEGVDPNQQYDYAIFPVYQEDYMGPWSNVVTATPVEYSLDEGLLIVDNSLDYTTPGFPTDADMDAFYESVAAHCEHNVWDCAAQGEPPLAELARYSAVIWHADDIQQGHITDNYYNLQNYLLAGGRLLVSQSRKLTQIDDERLEDIFGADEREFCFEPIVTGFAGQGWPDLVVDPGKIPMPTWGDNLAQVYRLEPVAGVETAFTVVAEDAGSPWQGASCAVLHEYGDNGGEVMTLGFPLYYLDADDVRAFIDALLREWGETDVDDNAAPAPALTLSAWPNPFNPSTSVAWSQSRPAAVKLCVYDVRGRRIVRRDLGHYTAGDHAWTWNAEGAPSGVYLLRLRVGDETAVRRAVLLK